MNTNIERELVILSREDAPRWYTLTVNPDTGFPCVVINRSTLARMKPLDKEAVARTRKDNNIGDDVPFTDKINIDDPNVEYFGFGNSLKRIRKNEEDRHVTLELQLPKFCSVTNVTCNVCNGSGKNKFGKQECSNCEGEGKEISHQQNHVTIPLVNISLLLSILRLAENKRTPREEDLKQLLIIEVFDRCICGSLSPAFNKLLLELGQHAEFDCVKRAMTVAHKYMWPVSYGASEEYLSHDILAHQNNPGNILLQVPGDTSQVHLHNPRNVCLGEGSELTCHNIDTRLQLFSLFTGMAAMCDMYEIAMPLMRKKEGL